MPFDNLPHSAALAEEAKQRFFAALKSPSATAQTVEDLGRQFIDVFGPTRPQSVAYILAREVHSGRDEIRDTCSKLWEQVVVQVAHRETVQMKIIASGLKDPNLTATAYKSATAPNKNGGSTGFPMRAAAFALKS